MKESIGTYLQITATKEFKELERLRERARHNEASALYNAEMKGEKRANEKWQSIVAEKEAENEKLRKQLAEFQVNE